MHACMDGWTNTRFRFFTPRAMLFLGVVKGSRDICGTLAGLPSPVAPSAPRDVPPCRRVLWGPPGLLQPWWNKGFPKKGASCRAKDSGLRVCVSPAGTEVICWETLPAPPEPPLFQSPAQRLVSSCTKGSVGQAEPTMPGNAGRQQMHCGIRVRSILTAATSVQG